MGKKCLKCSYVRLDTDVAPGYECPNCGAIYEKVEKAFDRDAGKTFRTVNKDQSSTRIYRQTAPLSDEDKIEVIKKNAAVEKHEKVTISLGSNNQTTIANPTITRLFLGIFVVISGFIALVGGIGLFTSMTSPSAKWFAFPLGLVLLVSGGSLYYWASKKRNTIKVERSKIFLSFMSLDEKLRQRTGIGISIGILLLLVALPIIWVILFEERTSSEQSAPKISDAECQKTLQCWAGRHEIDAILACSPKIERLAKYSHKWTDSILESKFTHLIWADQPRGVVTYMGDKIQFQNGFGAWQNYTYLCDYSPNNKQVVDVSVSKGRL